jgi:Brp/Blh family beta-carotene 15,15'-monooxygenase
MGLIRSPLFRPVAVVTGFLAVAAAALPAPDTTVSFLIAATVVVLVGIPHGAVDHLIANVGDPTRTGAPGDRVRFDWPFHVHYVAMIAAVLLVWVLAPTVALAAFLLVSIHHFGQSDLVYLARSGVPSGQQLALQWSRGLLLIALPLVAHLDVVAPTIERLGGGRPDQWGWLADHAAGWSAVLVAQHVAVGLVVVTLARRRSALDATAVRREAIGVGVLVALFVFADPLVGFAVYFGLWHSLGHVLVVRQTFGERRGSDSAPIAWSEFARLALARTLLSTLGVVGVVGALHAAGRPDDAVAALFVLVSAITVPHLVVVERLWRSARPTDAAPQGMRARLRNRPENAATTTAIDDAAITASPMTRS